MTTHKNILYLALSAFSQTGGIEKVNRGWLKALSEMEGEGEVKAHVLLDKDPDQRYISKSHFKGFNGNKLHFIISGLLAALKADTIVVSHINLAPLLVMAKIIKPKARIFLHAHGIEVWRILNRVQKKALVMADRILAVSEFTKEELIKRHQVSEDKITVFPNALDPFFEIPRILEKPAPLLKRYALSKDQKILFTLARLSSSEQYKGYEQVIKVIPKLLKQHPDLIYLIGGKADENEQKKLETLIASLQLQDRVKLLGYIAEEALTNHYLLADVFVMPSEGEGFGIAFIEAAVCGSQVIGGNLDGSTDALLNGDLGQMVNPNSENDIIGAIQIALSNRMHVPKKQQIKTIENFGFKRYIQQCHYLVFKSPINTYSN